MRKKRSITHIKSVSNVRLLTHMHVRLGIIKNKNKENIHAHTRPYS